MSFRAGAHLSDTAARLQASWHQCYCGWPLYFAHTSNSAQATASPQCKWIYTHNLTSFWSFPNAAVISLVATSMEAYIHWFMFYIDVYMEVYILDDFLPLIQVNLHCHFWIREFHAACHFARYPCWLLPTLWLAATALHATWNRTGPILSTCIAC